MEYTYDEITFLQINDILGKYIKVNLLAGSKTTKTTSLEGYLYTVDPITRTLVLLKDKGNLEDTKDKKIIEEEKEEKNDIEICEKKGETTIIENEKYENENENEEQKTIADYQIIVVMKSVIQTLSVLPKIEPLSNEFLNNILSNQDVIYIEKSDTIENLKESLIKYLQKNKIEYSSSDLIIRIYNDKVKIEPPYTLSCIQSDNYGSKNLATYHIKKWWEEKEIKKTE